MSLTLLQSYSSAEEEEDDAGEREEQLGYDKSEDEEENDGENGAVSRNRYEPLFDPNPSSSSALPSALDAFSEVSGPPEFLNNSVQEATNDAADNQRWRHGRRRNTRDKKDLPSGVVVEAKPKLVGIHERVRSDVEGSMPKTSSGQRNIITSAPAQGGKVAEDAADRMRICLTCGVPKTYTHSRGIVCPMCGDRPAGDANTEAGKKKGSTIKDKEKSKRMKGQSSHASWKSETEMSLRQQFD